MHSDVYILKISYSKERSKEKLKLLLGVTEYIYKSKKKIYILIDLHPSAIRLIYKTYIYLKHSSLTVISMSSNTNLYDTCFDVYFHR